MTEVALRAYLLGKLSESEVALVETRLIEDPDLFSQMETAEDDLFDAFARGSLDADERARFLERFGADANRRRFAKAFVTRTSSRKVVPFLRRPFIDLAIAATLVIVVGAIVMRPGPEPAAPATTPTPAATAAAAPVTSTVLLALGSSRAEGAPSKVAIDPGAARVNFRIRLNAADKFAAYAAQIRSHSDNVVWGDSVTPSMEGADLFVTAAVPAERLADGAYEIAIRGGPNAASLEDLGFIAIEVSRIR